MVNKLKTKKERSLHRIKILKGLLNKMEDAIARDGYCVEVIQQSMAIQRALKSLDALLLENHLDTCVKGNMSSKTVADQITKELLELFNLNNK